uniref:DHC_N1 domain-containing protein n=1 Tax=Echinostoma caproni TaxID=27848 RepID=A0A183B8V6_9TREM
LEEYCEPLYRRDPVTMVDCLPKLINAVRLIYGVSTYYNTAENITSLLVKITNQMILACRAYIFDRGRRDMWTKPFADTVRRLIDCCRLNEAYQENFHRVKEELDRRPDSRKFDFSEIYIFGKFNIFCRRLQAIRDVLEQTEHYAQMQTSNIEGLAPLIGQYTTAVTQLTKKPLNVLDQRDTEVDEEFELFFERMKAIQTGLEELFASKLDLIPSAQMAIQVIQQFDQLRLVESAIEPGYFRALIQFSKEIDQVAREYKKHKDQPAIPWDMPPVAGSVQVSMAQAIGAYRRGILVP